MKVLLMILIIATGFASCGPATDGNPKTDSTSMPVDTNMNKTEVNHVNSNVGTKAQDTTGGGSGRDSIFSH